MFDRLSSLRSAPVEVTLTLGYDDLDGLPPPLRSLTQGALTKGAAVAKWTASDPESAILQKVQAAAEDREVRLERVSAQLRTSESATVGDVADAATEAAGDEHKVRLKVDISASKPPLRSIELERSSASTASVVSTNLGLGIWQMLDVAHVTRLRCNDGVGSLWEANVLASFSSLRVLNLSNAQLPALPGVIGRLHRLQELRLVRNQLKLLPKELGELQHLRVLAIDSNELVILPGELARCTALEELSLSKNKLTNILLNFGNFRRLRTLHLHGNPLEYLPEISPCKELRTLSFANLEVHSDAGYTSFDVKLQEVETQSSTINISLFDSRPTDTLRPVLSILLRRSTGHHALVAGALCHLAAEKKIREIMCKQERLLEQLVVMTLNDDDVLVQQTCNLLTLLAQHSAHEAEAIAKATGPDWMANLLMLDDAPKQLSALQVIAAIGLASEPGADSMLSDQLLHMLATLAAKEDGDVRVRVAALETIGNLAFSHAGKARLVGHAQVMAILLRVSALDGASPSTFETVTTNGAFELPMPAQLKAAAVRALAVLGDIPAVGRAVGKAPERGRGLRVLAMDGGGMKGMATVRLLRALEERTGRQIHDLFDLIVGTSTGGLLAVAIGLRKFTLDECDAIYKVLGQRVFSRPTTSKEAAAAESWYDTLYRSLHSRTQHVRAVVVGYKHDASVYETLLKEYCTFQHDRRCLSDNLIDTAAMDVPKVALVATLASVSPAAPFVFRNYELPLATLREREQMCVHKGSSRHAVWQAVRASSAAIYYLDDFTCGEDKFQDGALVANNPGIVAVQEARALWPDTPIDVFVSVGTGSTPIHRRDRGLSSFVDAGSILLESSTDVERVHEALATMTPLMPGLKYFRFNPEDARCGMELDEINPEKWALLEAATDEYIEAHGEQFDRAAAALGGGQALSRAMPGSEQNGAPRLTLGVRKGLLVVCSPLATEPAALDVAAAACSRLQTCSATLDLSRVGASASTRAPGSHQRREAHKLRQNAKLTTPPTSPEPYATPSRASAQANPAASTAPASPAVPAVVEVDVSSALSSIMGWFSPTRKGPEPQALEFQNGTTDASLDGQAQQAQQGAVQAPPPSPASHPLTLDRTSPSAKSVTGEEQLHQQHAPVDPVHLLESAILDATPGVGIVHMGLRSCTQGIVLRWRETTSAVTVPSDEADSLVANAGADPSTTTLTQLFERQGGQLALGTTTVKAISTTYQHAPGGSLTSVVLVQHSSPMEVLDEGGITRLRHAITGKLVACCDVLPTGCMTAFTTAGCLAVLAPLLPTSAVPGCTGAVLTDFFKLLYAEIQNGGDCIAALEKAEAAQPALAGIFKLFW